MNQEQMNDYHQNAEHLMDMMLQLMNDQNVEPNVAAAALSNILAIVCVKELDLSREEFDDTFNNFWERAVMHYKSNGSGVAQ